MKVILLSYFFIRMILVFRRHHFFEYQKSKRAFITYYLLLVIYHMFDVILILQLLLSSLADDFRDYGFNRFTFSYFCEEKYYQNGAVYVFLSWQYLLRITFDPYAVSQILVIIFFKSVDDILQGICKLDYLIKISIFQFYKDPKLREEQIHGYTIASQGSDVGSSKFRFATQASRELNKGKTIDSVHTINSDEI